MAGGPGLAVVAMPPRLGNPAARHAMAAQPRRYRQFGGGLTDWLTPAQVAGLVRDRTVLPPTATSCTVPAEVKRDGPDFRMGTLTAYGPMEDFSYPPRPADARAPWHLQWTARIRHRSMTSWMEAEGMMMGGGGMSDAEEAPRQPACRPKRGLGGMLGGDSWLPVANSLTACKPNRSLLASSLHLPSHCSPWARSHAPQSAAGLLNPLLSLHGAAVARRRTLCRRLIEVNK